MKTRQRKLLKIAGYGAGAALLVTGFIGFAHTPQGRPLLSWLGAVPGCPVLENADPIAVEGRRVSWAARKAGAEQAPARPALGFELGHSRRAEVERELEQRGARCEAVRKDTALSCHDLESGNDDDALLQFDAAGRLVAVDVFRRTTSGERALALLGRAEADLTPKLGAATEARGERNAAYLEGQRFRQVVIEYRYSDYTARVAATNFGKDLRVREQYDWLGQRGG
jgi:hypothetical protein